ncbi:gamma-glutamyltransferase [Nocardioides lianchengensis]|uniref:Glutathione hydrolase proenzyme n=1 Tax=Nocardioides lianchengensis TaxID=1045774 RepID=A0A1G6ZCY4_9ACTN|nr:gamma-glutamyltransferase [Nocardioides lianchengensis]NYG11457.1 gamma-glutamyltranspeptidase/glutathione hydrolase [Nocardioides lianchengensis]SDD99606.1 gamma-glutamyltranspeptidase / glutathione hydrolase [Nocardioides lianchengensis]
MTSSLGRLPAVLLTLALPAGALVATSAAPAAAVPKKPTARGSGGAVASVDPYATQVGLRVLKAGGNAVDAAVATAAALGVTEPYSAGIGGGGYFVVYDAKTGKVRTIDGRETAPRKMPRDAFVDPKTGEPYPFTPDLVTSGVSVGVPGTPATWERALDRWGTWSLAETLAPATRIARKGFRVDKTFRDQTVDNQERFAAFRTTKRLFLKKGRAPRVGSTFRNPDLADTYDLLAKRGTRAFYEGKLARQIARTVRKPPKTKSTTLPVPRGFMTARDLKRYRTVAGRATQVAYRGYQVHGMPPSSSGGSTVGEALNILEGSDLGKLQRPAALHRYLEASALAFADRGEYVGDPRFTKVPLKDLLSQRFARERACAIDADQALPKPIAAGDVSSYDGKCGPSAPATAEPAEDTENISTTNLTVVDKWGNVVEYTLTIEQTGGSGIVVPGRGFLLNNELTDFSTVYEADDPNRIQPVKRPRSSMSPTIVTKKGKPVLALGSPGGSTIITTVLQMLVNRLDLGMSLPQAMAAPRAAQRNTADVTAEPAFITRYGAALEAYGHSLVPAGDAFTSQAEIGAATAIGIRGRRLVAVAEPDRRGGGAAGVVRPRKR